MVRNGQGPRETRFGFWPARVVSNTAVSLWKGEAALLVEGRARGLRRWRVRGLLDFKPHVNQGGSLSRAINSSNVQRGLRPLPSKTRPAPPLCARLCQVREPRPRKAGRSPPGARTRRNGDSLTARAAGVGGRRRPQVRARTAPRVHWSNMCRFLPSAGVADAWRSRGGAAAAVAVR